MALPVVLTLDLATTTGWCCGRLGEEPRWGAWDLQGGTYGDRYRRLADHMAAVICRHEKLGEPISEVCFEAPLARQQKTVSVARVLMGLAAIAEYVGSRFALRVSEAHVGKTRAAVLGQGRFAKGADVKAEVDRLCRLQGWDIPQADARDAFVLWKHVELLRAPRLAGSGAAFRALLPMRLETPSLPGL